MQTIIEILNIIESIVVIVSGGSLVVFLIASYIER
jgi:hypothetical protein